MGACLASSSVSSPSYCDSESPPVPVPFIPSSSSSSPLSLLSSSPYASIDKIAIDIVLICRCISVTNVDSYAFINHDCCAKVLNSSKSTTPSPFTSISLINSFTSSIVIIRPIFVNAFCNSILSIVPPLSSSNSSNISFISCSVIFAISFSSSYTILFISSIDRTFVNVLFLACILFIDFISSSFNVHFSCSFSSSSTICAIAPTLSNTDCITISSAFSSSSISES
mmetsp:Transcript_69954/g.62722  ORF Transcript_69954/g.62722 Transcript_69954/m.62722 type:complete len:226 (-) Transcript_69954:75-752(-)